MHERRLVILGSTGSIGTQTLEVCAASAGRLIPVGLSVHSSVDLLCQQIDTYRPKWVTVTGTSDEKLLKPLRSRPAEVFLGEAGVLQMVTSPETDVVVAAMVGAAGLRSTLAALTANKLVALANKESLVVGGPIVRSMTKNKPGLIIPVDSEHSAIFQALEAGRREDVAKIYLTASGGPFRSRPIDTFTEITPAEALKHPTWNMGPKITIDSATMMNKALEIIEAHWLFDLSPDQIEVVIHPQSIVHSMVEYVDGSVIAQLSPPDMRLPIQYALTHPVRWKGPAKRMNFRDTSTWEFISPDRNRYPSLDLGFEVIRRGGTSGSALNAANEVAVQRFLDGEIKFPDIVRLCRDILAQHKYVAEPTLEDLERTDRTARQEASVWK